jgi:kynureninase
MTLASTAPHGLARYRSEFPIFEQCAYLNTCSLGALSRRSRQRLDAFLDQWEARGAANWYDVWWQALDELRRGYAAVVGANAGEIALHASVSTATAVVASALDYAKRRKVVTTELDFPTVAYQWLARRPFGVEVVVVPSPDGISVPVEALADAIDDRTALVATSHAYFTTGAVQDIAAVAAAAHARGALCYIDAYQSVGQVPLAVRRSGVDFLVAGGLKWLLGGPGIAFLYVRHDLIPALRPDVTGWFAHKEQFAFDPRRFTPHDDARRFEQGTPALAAVHTQLGGLDLIVEIGVDAIRDVTRALTDDLIDRLRDIGRPPKAAREPDRRSAIVMVPDADAPSTVSRLGAAGVIADARPGHVRLAPFFYNIPDDHARAIDALRT